MDIDLISQRVSEIVQSQDVAEARSLLSELSIGGANSEGNDAAAGFMRQLLFLRLPQLELDQAAWLLQHYVLEGFQVKGYDFPARVQDAVSLVFDTDKRADMLHHFLTAVESSDELLGDKPLIIDAAEVAPMVQNWIKDYNYWPTENKLRQSIDAVNYASKAPNPQKLTAEDRALLIKLLGWYDEIRNSLYDYEASEDIDLEQYPNFDPRLLTASLDEFESPEAARQALDKALAVKKSNPLSGVPQSGSGSRPAQATPPSGMTVNTPRPNIQGVLSNAPIKRDATMADWEGSPSPAQGLGKNQAVAPAEKPNIKSAPVPSVAAPAKAQGTQPVSAPGPSFVPQKQKPVLPAKVPENLPMVEPEDLPAVVQPKRTNVSSSKPTATGQKPPQPVSLPPTLNMNKIQAEVAQKKSVAQSDIDQRLASLKKRSTGKN